MLKKIKLGLVPKLLIAIGLGVLVGQLTFIPDFLLQIPVTLSALFSQLLAFIIPLMIVGYVIKGISDLTDGAGKLLGLNVLLAYSNTSIGGFIAYFLASSLFPLFIDASVRETVQIDGTELSPLFTFPLEPLFSVTSAIVFAFLFGVFISWLRKEKKGEVLYNVFTEFGEIITQILNTIIIPGLPIYIFGNFLNLSYSGAVFSLLSVFWRVFIVVISLQILLLIILFTLAGLYTGKNPIVLLKNQIPGYFTALGTQSSAATIPVNMECARKNGVSKEIREFVIPLSSTIHLMGSVVTITSCVTAVLLMFDMPHSFSMMAGFIATLGVALVAAPGAPGGAIMSALPFVYIVGIDPTGSLGNLLISLYITQDSFGTAANISGDNAIALIIDKVYNKYIS
ncbi:dicarboxylate/amino acid:cation symporter [Marinilactibacillus psychrotolerans]|uniref:Dicarboxylate/amino acid:cation symporter n=1 Tax=Marinilactibacillus psychrotolerans TaxID=191770 RepID=A0A5R9C2N1_9LACT|nr:dicarboxylate/amino acid:cation symporter [Marinilactibacillus psychrotolerans]TLQ07004.1 dicarboxylate/amino acid:cation symporter [Marinilactibacillus psychrotolerans]